MISAKTGALMIPTQNVLGAIARSTRFTYWVKGMSSSQRHSSAPPVSPMMSAMTVSSGRAITNPSTRGRINTSNGSTPVATRASTSSFNFIAPISAANALPERPATMMAVSSTPSSRRTPMVTRSTTKISAPKLRSCWALIYAMITAIRKAISETIGMAVMPVS